MVYKIEPEERIFYFTKYHLSSEIKRCAKLAGLQPIRVHDLRHSHTAMLIEKGYNILLISERLGHENVETTLNTYGHLYPNKHRELADDRKRKIIPCIINAGAAFASAFLSNMEFFYHLI